MALSASEIAAIAEQTSALLAERLRPRRLIGHEEVAALVGRPGVHRTTVNRWAREGSIPRGVVVGGELRWRLDEIEAAIERLPRQGDHPA